VIHFFGIHCFTVGAMKPMQRSILHGCHASVLYADAHECEVLEARSGHTSMRSH
jgi:hypothetical protein